MRLPETPLHTLVSPSKGDGAFTGRIARKCAPNGAWDDGLWLFALGSE